MTNRTERPLTTHDVLRRAAVISGVDASGAVVIREGSNAIVRLPNGIVARIGRPGAYSAAHRELRISRWLDSSGIPTVQALPGVPQPVRIGERPVTWWRTIPEHRPSTPAEIGTVLRALHALPAPTDFTLPAYDPFAELRARIENAGCIDSDDRMWLTRHHDRLHREYGSVIEPSSSAVIHGDAWQGNVVVPESGAPIVLDLDKVSLGRREWDLIQLAVDHADFERVSDAEYHSFVAAYGGYDVTEWHCFRLFADIQELRWTCFAAELSESNQSAADEARYRIECLRGLHPQPWTWHAL